MSQRVFKLADKQEIADDIFSLKLEASDDLALEFEAGQFVSIEVGDNQRRSYSIASPPQQSDHLELNISTKPGGVGSKYVEALEVGAEVKGLFPLGVFVYKPDASKPAFMFSGGTGLAPFLSMVSYELEVIKSGREVQLYYGAKFRIDVFAADKLEVWAAKYPNFSYKIYVEEPDAEWKGLTGRYSSAVEQWRNLGADFYMCGAQGMIEAFEDILEAKGVDPANIYHEQFY